MAVLSLGMKWCSTETMPSSPGEGKRNGTVDFKMDAVSSCGSGREHPRLDTLKPGKSGSYGPDKAHERPLLPVAEAAAAGLLKFDIVSRLGELAAYVSAATSA